MKEIEIHGKRFIPYIAFEEIEHAIIDMANKIYDEYKDEVPVFVGVLNGVVMFMSDFLKHYPGECEISFLKLSSYEGTETTGKVKIQMDIPISVEGRNVIILEDIVDTGNTLVELHKILTEKKVKSLKIATLLFKPDAYKKDLVVDLVGLSIPDKFVVGYGLDFDGFGRNLPDIYQIKS
ncbi:hypoxanthine phosphoribosyltransferase [Weeksella virosa]|uniref:hypoxanthine phosphoribosyltransferase n=1 Tax=Weeksella virosa TaxID=1014 RepID=UPI00255240C9|nr:hypoxanthine phosphoribosyltransferase [Weeksella virosa]MDK7374955.1 hypoxanthine phosphoribosyltransferase [Weeksella virosa]